MKWEKYNNTKSQKYVSILQQLIFVIYLCDHQRY